MTEQSVPREGKAIDIARELGLSRMAVSKLVRREDFPAPLRTTAAPKYRTGTYDLDVVSRWYKEDFNPKGHRHGPRPNRESPDPTAQGPGSPEK
jgi:hypothetical protein